MKLFKHLKTILIHKYWVFYFGRKLGIGWRAFVHDLSKFSPIEFFEGVRYYTGRRSPIDEAKELHGYSKAWLHHRGRNPHHYEYWQDNFDTGGNPIPMPLKYKLEMLCDYLAAAVTYSQKTVTFHDEYRWWNNKRSGNIAMHPSTLYFLDSIFEYLNQYFGDVLIHKFDSAISQLLKDKITDIEKIHILRGTN